MSSAPSLMSSLSNMFQSVINQDGGAKKKSKSHKKGGMAPLEVSFGGAKKKSKSHKKGGMAPINLGGDDQAGGAKKKSKSHKRKGGMAPLELLSGGAGKGAPMNIDKKFRATERKSARIFKKKIEKAMDKYDDMLTALGGIEKEVKKDIALVKKQKDQKYKECVDELTLAFSKTKFAGSKKSKK